MVRVGQRGDRAGVVEEGFGFWYVVAKRPLGTVMSALASPSLSMLMSVATVVGNG